MGDKPTPATRANVSKRFAHLADDISSLDRLAESITQPGASFLFRRAAAKLHEVLAMIEYGVRSIKEDGGTIAPEAAFLMHCRDADPRCGCTWDSERGVPAPHEACEKGRALAASVTPLPVAPQ